jgi:glutathione S-transferase
MLEETGVPYQLLRMPFPPRFKHPDYLQINPLGTVPALRIDGDLMTESAAMCEFLAAFAQNGNLRVDPSEADYAAYLNWLHRSDTTLTFPLALILRYSKLEPPERRVPQVVEDYSRWFFKRAESVENALQHSDFCAETGSPRLMFA